MSRAIPDGIPLKYHDVMIALSKARAASILLRADADYLQLPIRLRPDEDEAHS